MEYTDLIFDLYGTLVDIHTEETDAVWEKTALYLGFYGVHFTGPELKTAFGAELRRREAKAGRSWECFPDIPFEGILASLARQQGAEAPETLGLNAAQLFRVCSIEYLRIYPGVREALRLLRQQGCRLWLLSNAQRVFTAYELRHLGLGAEFDGICISSDFGFRKPDKRFFRALLEGQNLDPRRCLMIGNDLETDIAGAKNAGIAAFYMHTALTPPEQRPANAEDPFEFEGDDWNQLGPVLVDIAATGGIISPEHHRSTGGQL